VNYLLRPDGYGYDQNVYGSPKANQERRIDTWSTGHIWPVTSSNVPNRPSVTKPTMENGYNFKTVSDVTTASIDQFLLETVAAKSIGNVIFGLRCP
jgi:hypothetical protein